MLHPLQLVLAEGRSKQLRLGPKVVWRRETP